MPDSEREQAIAAHIEWCRRECERRERNLLAYASGHRRMGHMNGDGTFIDQTADYLERQRAIIRQLEAIIAMEGSL